MTRNLSVLMVILAIIISSCKEEKVAPTVAAPVDPTTLTFEQKLQEKMNQMKGNEEWFKLIEKKAIENNISVDSMLYIDAVWTLQQDSINAAKASVPAGSADTTAAK